MFYVFRAHWQLIVLCPQENIVVWLCSLRKKPDVNFKGVVNRLLSEFQVKQCIAVVVVKHNDFYIIYFTSILKLVQ